MNCPRDEGTGGLMNRMGPEILEKPDRTYPVPENQTQPEERSQLYHPRAVQTTGFPVPNTGSGPSETMLLFPDIIPLLWSPNRETRIMAITALKTSGDRQAVEPLFRACMDEDDQVKQAAREALAAIAMRLR